MVARNFRIKIEPDKFYHIWNRGNNRDNLFYKQKNYEYFICLYDEYMDKVIETYAFCLLPNHFHLLIRTKAVASNQQFHQIGETAVKSVVNPVSCAFRKLFMAYSQAINIQERRTGSLFRKSFKRLEVNNPKYFAALVQYIHTNPQKHGIIEDFRQYPWSSYQRMIKSKPSKLKKDEVIEWFKNKQNYLQYHGLSIDLDEIKHLIIE
ncbi:MAG: transposase [Prolixibacteraceae bacterium]|nr:transposase [Prolixibacteraceae bacterium]